jgi:hypothetical protein
MLPQADAFLSAVHLGATFENVVHVHMLYEMWKLKPNCTLGIRKKLLTSLFQKIASGLKLAATSVTKEGSELVVWVSDAQLASWRDIRERLDRRSVASSSGTKSEDREIRLLEKRSKKESKPFRETENKILLVLALPRFLDILKLYDLTFSDVNVADNQYFIALNGWGWKDVKSVAFKSVRSLGNMPR